MGIRKQTGKIIYVLLNGIQITLIIPMKKFARCDHIWPTKWRVVQTFLLMTLVPGKHRTWYAPETGPLRRLVAASSSKSLLDYLDWVVCSNKPNHSYSPIFPWEFAKSRPIPSCNLKKSRLHWTVSWGPNELNPRFLLVKIVKSQVWLVKSPFQSAKSC